LIGHSLHHFHHFLFFNQSFLFPIDQLSWHFISRVCLETKPRKNSPCHIHFIATKTWKYLRFPLMRYHENLKLSSSLVKISWKYFKIISFIIVKIPSGRRN
jgi:hypothetical protein